VNAIASFLLVVLAQVASPPVAETQAKATAQALLKEGTALYERGDFAAALEKFEAAYGVYASPKLLFNIAQADRDLGRPVDALQAFEKFLAQAPDAAVDVLSEARQSVTELRGKLGQVKIECSTAGAEAAIDGKTVGTTPLAQPIWVTPGRHQIVIRHEGYGSAVVNVVPGEIQTVRLEARWRPMPAADALAMSMSAPTSATFGDSQPGVVASSHRKDWWSDRKWYVWAAAGGTVLFATGAIVAGLSANSRFNDLQNSCGSTSAGCSESQIDGVKSRAALTDVLWILAGASAVAIGVSFYLDSREAGVSVAW
jgi:hypothetical protein